MKKIFTLLFALVTLGASAQVRISQVYGGGGNTGATYTNDFVELFNAGTSTVDISGWSVQYTSAAGTGTWSVGTIPPLSSIPAGGYFLVGFQGGTSGGVALPTTNSTAAFNMSATSGKVALANNNTALSGANGCTAASVVDAFGFGSGSCFESAVFSTTGITNTSSMHRKLSGCTDANNNSTDFEILPVAPRNSATTANPCGAAVAALSALPANITGVTTVFGTASAEQTITLSGSNLTGFPSNITVTASANLEISLTSGGTFTSDVSVPYTSASLSATSIYARITATAALGAVSGTITSAGGGAAISPVVNFSGSVNTPEPTVQASNVIISNVGATSFDVSFTNGNGSDRLVTLKTQAAPKAAPIDGITYTVGSITGSSNSVVHIGSGPFTVTGLVPGTGYTVQAYEFNGSGSSSNYLAADGTVNPTNATTTGAVPTLTQANFTSISTPQYGASGTATRIPVLYYATVSGLAPNTTYRYFTQAAATTDFTTTATGAGNSILFDYTANPVTYTYTTGGSISTANNYGKFTTNASGSFTGAFGHVNTSNARFNAGLSIFPSIAIGEENALGIQYRFALNQSITNLSFGTTSALIEGTFIKGTSEATAGNIVGLWATIDGNAVAARPLSMTIVENPTFLGAAWPTSFVTGYDLTTGSWNTIIPNANANGVRLIQQFDLRTANPLGCNSDADGIWPTGTANTVNPIGGTTAIQIESVDASLDGGGASCFGLLPVQLSSFAVQKTGNNASIFWTTEQEINSKEFVIERATNGGTFTAIATVRAAGNSAAKLSYSFTDIAPTKGVQLYRLRLVDFDGKFSNSATKSVLFGNTDVVLVTPNPATTFVNIYMGKNNNSLSQIIVTSANGKMIEKINTADQTYQIQTSNYAKGLYFIRVISEGNSSTQKVIIQ